MQDSAANHASKTTCQGNEATRGLLGQAGGITVRQFGPPVLRRSADPPFCRQDCQQADKTPDRWRVIHTTRLTPGLT